MAIMKNVRVPTSRWNTKYEVVHKCKGNSGTAGFLPRYNDAYDDDDGA